MISTHNCASKDQAQGPLSAAAEHERLEEHATHDHTGCCRKAPVYAGQSVSALNNSRTLWLPDTSI